MLILFDHGAPKGVARAFRGHTVITAVERGWDRLNNGALLKVAEEEAVDLLRKIAIVVLTEGPNVHVYACTWNASPPR